ncbi:sigma-54 dependent transcriptional regulator [Mesorhizobium sp. YM1C-6-2]|uniref:sigma-54-dependent transcriptional regulator n=1 Tax=Mesorhizobium sp. YM1C-6-2 TaxID=1827501 RepID=UPI000EF1B91C|nr:sigma-54 dependent transcriptional regulator [Mesorhizobium sp. YM1C-6-2]RLP26870.1 sigma-54-dependent Fis family transcriptional regulator [Mesorhizobium sp. YM1C-6-2]
MAGSILIVDDDPVQRRLLQAALQKFGYETLLAEGGEAALAALETAAGGDIAAIVLDLAMPGIDGIGVLQAMRERGIAIPVVVQTAQGGIDTVVSAMRNGAVDFVVKPASPERLRTAIANALKVEALEADARRAQRKGGVVTFRDIVTRSPAMDKVIRLAQKAAASNIPILVEGESGVGKELVARAIQGSGERRSKPFVTVNCGAIPDNLVESILFGHEKGSFTGATEKHVGKFVEAHGGTLFLDEIGDLPLDVQVKLLRAVQDGEIDPVGGKSTVKVDIRLISATHRDLLQQVKDGKFREDLFYRLNVYPIVVPPLRERRADIPYLVRHFMARVASGKGAPRIDKISEGALAMLGAYDWPGNIRQLENAVFRASVLCEGDTLTEEEFPQIRAQMEGSIDLDRHETRPGNGLATAAAESPGVAPQPPAAAFGILKALDERGNVRTLADVEVEMIRLAIDHYRGQMSEVARRLGIGRSTLYRKLKEYGIDPEAGRADREDRLAS